MIMPAAFLPLRWLIPFSALVFIFFFFRNRQVLYRLKNKLFLAIIFLIIIIQPFLYGSNPVSAAGISFYTDTFSNGLRMALRALVFMTAFSFLATSIDKNQIDKFWRKAGLKDFPEVFSYSRILFDGNSRKIKADLKLITKKGHKSIPHMMASLIKNADSYAENNHSKEST
jgi:hypothetical protein